MHPTLQYDVMQAIRRDQLRSTARQRAAMQARAARLPRDDRTPASPRRRLPHLVWRLLPS
jgi:hypothetical protein